jgi:23S rRNA (guanosine2251-2'-O)-methyltransferase
MSRFQKRGSRFGLSDNESRVNKHCKGGRPLLKNENELESYLKSIKDPFVLILDGVQDPHNLGACIRTANGAGVDAVIIPRDNAAPITETVQSISCGGAAATPIFRVVNISRIMDKLKGLGVWIAGTSDKATQGLYTSDLRGPIALVMGSEGKGMRRLTEEKCDYLLTIPMTGVVPCLNVSVATGVCLYEIKRQRALE